MYQFSNGSNLRNIFLAISISALSAAIPTYAQVTTTDTTEAAVVLSPEERFAATLQHLFADGGARSCGFRQLLFRA